VEKLTPCMPRANQKKEIIMQIFKTTILVASLAALAGCASHVKQADVCVENGWFGYIHKDPCPKAMASEAPRDFAAELATAQKQNSDLERQLAASKQRADGFEAQLAAMSGAAIGHLASAEKDLLRALQPEISKGTVSVRQSGNTLTINLTSGLLFDSGQDQLKAGGTDALKRVGNVLKDFPGKQVDVAGYTDNVAIKKGALQKKFPSNKELSDARANSAAQALRDGGVSSNLSIEGHGDSNPIAGNNTAAGRAKNRRVEVRVT
jgi:chemotaxis protein MotB